MNTNKKILSCLTILVMLGSSCSNFLEAPLPRGKVVVESIAKDASLINAAVTGMYSSFYSSTAPSADIGLLYQAVLSDEVDIRMDVSFAKTQRVGTYSFEHSTNVSNFWAACYMMVNRANSILDLVPSISVSTLPQAKIDEIKAAALLTRSIAYLYLIDYFGDVPLLVSSDVTQYLSASRTAKKEVFAKVISDLKEAVNLLPATAAKSSFLFTSKFQAQAVLAKALMSNDIVLMSNEIYAEAEALATSVIEGGGYRLSENYTDVVNFSNNPEAIFSFYGGQFNEVVKPFRFESYFVYNLALENTDYIPWENPTPTQDLIESFEDGDPRIAWTVYNNDAGEVVPSLNKFNTDLYEQAQSYIRLGEIFLLRAEARIQQNKVDEGIADINEIRQRVQLPDLANGLSKEAAFAALKLERRHEMFSEGVRWSDIKRWGDADAILRKRQELGKTDPRITPLAEYKKERLLFPIPPSEIILNPKLVQNPGWN